MSLWVRDVEPDRAAWEARAHGPTTCNGNFGPRAKRPHRQQLEKEAEIARLQAEGRDRIGRLTEKEFLVAGVALYAGEGAKTGNEVRFANSDPRMMLFFVTWLRHFFEIDEHRLRLRLYLHRGSRSRCSASDFWARSAPHPARRSSIKPYRAVSGPEHPPEQAPDGLPERDTTARLRRCGPSWGCTTALLALPNALPG